MLLAPSAAVGAVAPQETPLATTPQVGNVPDNLAVAGRCLRCRHAGQCRRRLVASALLAHALHLALLGFGELRRDHHQAQVDHEERTDLRQKQLHWFH